MDLAIESGMIAGNAAKNIIDSKDYENTEIYKKMLDKSSIMNDLFVARPMFNLLNQDNIFKKYPGFINDFLSSMMDITDDNRKKLMDVMFEKAHENGMSVASLLRDATKVI